MTTSALIYWRHSRPAAARTGAGRPCRGWSQARAARYLGVSLASYHRWERGLRPVPKTVAMVVTRELNGKGKR